MVMDEMGKSTLETTTGSAAGTTSYVSSSIFSNHPLMSALIAFALAQSFKLLLSWYAFDPSRNTNALESACVLLYLIFFFVFKKSWKWDL